MTLTNIHNIVSNTHAERDGKSGQDLRMADGSLWFHPYSGAEPVQIEQSDAHNPDTNPNWKPLVADRIYECDECHTRQKISTNHTGTVWAVKCAGTCRDIFAPHTAHERVIWHPARRHNYISEAGK